MESGLVLDGWGFEQEGKLQELRLNGTGAGDWGGVWVMSSEGWICGIMVLLGSLDSCCCCWGDGGLLVWGD